MMFAARRMSSFTRWALGGVALIALAGCGESPSSVGPGPAVVAAVPPPPPPNFGAEGEAPGQREDRIASSPSASQGSNLSGEANADASAQSPSESAQPASDKDVAGASGGE